MATTTHHQESSPPIPFPPNVPTAPLLTISLPPLLSHDPTEHARLYEASKSLGFFYLGLRGCAEGETLLRDADTLFDLMRQFFELPVEEKQRYDFAKEGGYFGYKGMGAEVIDGKGTRDRNEIYNISKDDILDVGPALPAPNLITTNRLLLTRHIHENNAILRTLFDSLSNSLGLSDSSFADLHRLNSPSGCHVRFIHAPPPPPSPNSQSPSPASPALGEHTDFGSLTILFNRIGGLQVLLPGTSNWVYVRPVPGCAIINLGDAMVKFSEGVLRSNLHRVVGPPGGQAGLERYSLVYFSRPEYDVRLRRLRGREIDGVGGVDGDGNGGEGEEEGVSSREWLKRRHLGRKMQFFKGSESWEGAKGTEGRRL